MYFKRLMPISPDRLAIAGLALMSVAAIASINLAPRPAQNVAVVFPPWLSGGEAVRRATAAGAALVRSGRFPFILIVRPTSATFPTNAMSRGALLVLDAQAVHGCLSRRDQAS